MSAREKVKKIERGKKEREKERNRKRGKKNIGKPVILYFCPHPAVDSNFFSF